MFSVVILGPAEGVDDLSTGLLATTRDVSGDRSGAFVLFGSARRATARDFGFGVVNGDPDTAFREAFGVLAAAGSVMRPTALGVGVAGGGTAVVLRSRRLGVEGVEGNGSPPFTVDAGSDGDNFLLVERTAVGAGGAIDDSSAWALRRADLLLAMLQCLGRLEGHSALLKPAVCRIPVRVHRILVIRKMDVRSMNGLGTIISSAQAGHRR